MTSRRITREKFDAMVKEKVEVYGMTIDEAIERTIQQRQMQGPSRSLMTRAEGDGRFSSDNVFWRDELEPFFSRESDSDFVRFHTGHQHGTSSLSTGQMESHSFEHPGTSKPKFLHPGDKGKFYKGFLKGKPGKQSLVKGDPEWPFKTSRSQKKERKIDLMDESDIMSKFGSQIIKWAGFNTMQNDDIFKEQHMALFKVTTESCAKMLASYKCSIKEAQQEYCYFSIDNLKHPALKSPSVDNAFLSMLKENKLIKSRNSFIELLNPADNELMKVQARLLKAGIPLLMACNAYEIDQKIEGLHSIAQLSNALEKSISLCRKSLVLLGQTYAFVTSCRQEKILNIVGLSEKAPKPTSFPNLDDSALFGKEYLAYLKTWMEKTGCTFQLKKEEHAEEEQGETLIREEKKEINTSSSAGEQPTDLAAEEKCEAPTELPVEERKIPVLKTSEELKDNPILLAIKERLDILQAGEERQDIPILQAIRERLSIPVLQAIKERLSESGSQAGGEKKIPADQTSTKEAEIPFLEANIKEAAIPFLDAGTKEAAIPFLDAGTKEAAIPFLDAGTKEVGIHFLDTGTEGAEIPFLDAGTKEAEIPVLQTPATEGKEIPVLQAREQRKKYISPKSFLRPPQTPALGSGQIQQFLSVRRGFPYKCTQTGVNLSNLLTFPRSNPNPTVCKANEGHSVAKSKDVKRTMYRSKSLHDKAERSSGPDSQPLQSEHLKAMDTIDHLMHNAVGISKRKLVDKEKPPFWHVLLNETKPREYSDSQMSKLLPSVSSCYVTPSETSGLYPPTSRWKQRTQFSLVTSPLFSGGAAQEQTQYSQMIGRSGGAAGFSLGLPLLFTWDLAAGVVKGQAPDMSSVASPQFELPVSDAT
ncbi:uncharacterized protein LOC115097842 [Rhinatrema bivittatum]|uniref:uncharacterized protein LOC115097842 n=1 Tax=Rhinatrema bivittatum TaxID=194408 RepID=UPI00112E8B98|nr:uncharacterized protein LOC115097842 [Rhinatrema bivittatum]XP_029469810.1 uncharacterized protein LOC115097842 [Rhinatrema bivittatum]